MRRFLPLLSLCVLLILPTLLQAAEMRLAVTTSFNNSGLSDVLLPRIEERAGITVRLLVVGTGQALKLGRAGDVDAVLVHSRAAEEAFVAQGFGTHRREIMYNDFVVVGPMNDPAGISDATSVVDAFDRIRKSQSLFVSRGDESGTHKKELAIWRDGGVDVSAFDPAWYREAGAGMGASLNTASGMNAYIMSDRASWLKFSNKGELKLLYSGDEQLFNQYAFIPVNPQKHPHVKHSLALRLERWLTSKVGQSLIANYTLNGQVLFVPNAK